MHGWPLGQRPQPTQGVQGGGQQPVVTPVGGGGDRAQWDPGAIAGQGALAAPLAAVDRTGAGDLTAAGGLGDAAVDGQVVKVETDDGVVGGQGELVEPGVDVCGDPLVAAAAQGPRRAGVVSDALVGTAEDEDLDQFVEDDPVGDTWAVTAERMERLLRRQQY